MPLRRYTRNKVHTRENPVDYIPLCTIVSWNVDRAKKDKDNCPTELVRSLREDVFDAYIAKRQPDIFLLEELVDMDKDGFEAVKAVAKKAIAKDCIHSTKPKKGEIESTYGHGIISHGMASSLDRQQVKNIWKKDSSCFKISGIVDGCFDPSGDKDEVSVPVLTHSKSFESFLKQDDVRDLRNENRICMLVLEAKVGEREGKFPKLIIASYHQRGGKADKKKKLFRAFIELAEKASEEFGCEGNYILGSDTNAAEGNIEPTVEILSNNRSRENPPNFIYSGKDILLWKFPNAIFSISHETEFDDIEGMTKDNGWLVSGILPEKGFNTLLDHNPATFELKIKRSALSEENIKLLEEISKDQEERKVSVKKEVLEEQERKTIGFSESVRSEFQRKLEQFSEYWSKQETTLLTEDQQKVLQNIAATIAKEKIRENKRKVHPEE